MKIVKMIKDILIIAVIIVLIFLIYNKLNNNSKLKISASSDLEKVIDISEIQTAKYTWNGIAEINNTYVRYEGTVQVNYDMKDFFKDNIKLDNANKKIHLKIPETKYEPIVLAKSNSISFIPANAEIDMKDVLNACEEDMKEEIKDNERLNEIAKNNFKSIIESFLYPITENSSFEFIWDGE